jgi:hypothetical protein
MISCNKKSKQLRPLPLHADTIQPSHYIRMQPYIYQSVFHGCRVELLVSHRATLQMAYRGTLTGYGGYWRNKITAADQNQHYCLVANGDLQRLGEETPTENQPTQRLRWQPYH